MMASSEGYSLIYHKGKNQIIITLPQTNETPTNTVEPPVKRKLDMNEAEAALLLGMVKSFFNYSKESSNE